MNTNPHTVAPIWDSPWFIAITVLLIATAVISFLWVLYKRACRSIIGRIIYEREFSEEGVYEDDTVTFTETIYNKSRLPLINVYAESYIYPELELNGCSAKDKKAMQLFQSRYPLILPYMQIKRKHKVHCTARGLYKLESARLFLPGADRYTDSTAQIYVYPQILDAPTTPMPVGLLMGESVSKRMLIRDPFSMSGIRPYTYGDPPNSINHKATARAYAYSASSPLMVNQRDFSSDRTFMIYLNFQCNPAEPIPSHIFNKLMENSLSYCADIIRVAKDNGYKLGLCANCVMADSSVGIQFDIRAGEIHLTEMLRALSEVRIASGMSFPVLLEKDIEKGLSDTEIFLFTTYTDEETENCLYALSMNRNTVNTVILTPEKDDEEKEDEER